MAKYKSGQRINVMFPVHLEDIIDCQGMDDFNNLLDEYMLGKKEFYNLTLTDISYKPISVSKDSMINIQASGILEEC